MEETVDLKDVSTFCQFYPFLRCLSMRSLASRNPPFFFVEILFDGVFRGVGLYTSSQLFTTFHSIVYAMFFCELKIENLHFSDTPDGTQPFDNILPFFFVTLLCYYPVIQALFFWQTPSHEGAYPPHPTPSNTLFFIFIFFGTKKPPTFRSKRTRKDLKPRKR